MNGVIQREEVPAYEAWRPEGWARVANVGQVDPPAEEPVAEIEAATRERVAQIEQQAREQGHERGYAEGHRAGLEHGRQEGQVELKAQLGALAALYGQVARPLERVDQGVEEALAQLAMVVAERLVAHELSLHPERVVAVVRQALRALPMGTEATTIHLHPDDVALVHAAASPEQAWRLLEDPELQRGECVVTTPKSRLDSRLKTRLAAIADAVLGEALAEEAAHHG